MGVGSLEAEGALIERSVASLAAQTHQSWTLSVAVAEGEAAEGLGHALAPLGSRAVVCGVPAGTPAEDGLASALGAAPVSGTGVSLGDDPAVMVLWPGDELAPDALQCLLDALRESDAPVVYADEDRADADGSLYGPVLKPAWSPDLLLSAPYLGRALLVRRSHLVAAGGLHSLEGGSAEHDLMLRLTDGLANVPHVAEVLYHRRAPVTSPPGPADPGDVEGPAAVTGALARRGEPADVVAGPLLGTWSVRRRPADPVRASVIVPFRDGATLLRECADTVTATASDVELELVLVDNGSRDPETLTLVEQLDAMSAVTVLRDDSPFNWAALNNAAARVATGDVFVFLNNDVECRRDGWLADMAAHALRPDVGAVGARLLYPDERVQHAGVVIGIGGAAGHVLAGLPADEPGYLGMAVLTRDCTAVTGACLATRREVFFDLDGFDESLGLDLNDIDYCMRARRRGLRVVYEPRAELVHHESPSRGTSGSVPDIERFIDRWEQDILAGDPHLNPNLTRVDCSCALRGLGEKGWWQEWRSSLQRS
jgi:GT2 family glycosyltransferase